MVTKAKPGVAMECGDAIVQAIGEMPYQRAGEPWSDYQERLIAFLTKLWQAGRSAGMEHAVGLCGREESDPPAECSEYIDGWMAAYANLAAILQRKETR